MRISWLRFAPALLLLTAACADFPLFWKGQEPLVAAGQSEQSPGRATLEFQDARYDGESLAGRLLLGAESGVEALLLLVPGYWYGSTVRFKLFSERFTGLGPECIEVELTVFSFEGKPLASTRVRAEWPAASGGGAGRVDYPW